MKVLVVSLHDAQSYKSRLHLGFLKNLSRYCTQYTVIDRDKLFILSNNKPKRRIKTPATTLYKKYKPDVMICYASDGFRFNHQYFSKVPCVKILIEVDFHKMTHKEDRVKWFKNNRFNLVLNRGYYNRKAVKMVGVPTAWLPFSVDLKEFSRSKPERRNVIGFAGNTKPRVYIQRRKAVRMLTKAKLLDNRNKSLKTSEAYVNFLKSVKGSLNSNEINSPYGKVFEIMASGSALLSPTFGGTEILFGDVGDYYFSYKEDCTNLVSQAKRLLNNNDLRRQIVMNARRSIKENHTHEKRIRELKIHITNLLQGKPIKHFWRV